MDDRNIVCTRCIGTKFIRRNGVQVNCPKCLGTGHHEEGWMRDWEETPDDSASLRRREPKPGVYYNL